MYYQPLRDHPKGTELVHQTEGTVTLKFKAAIRFWWKLIFLMIPMTLAAPFVGAFIGAALAIAEQQRRYDLGEYRNTDIGAWSFQGGVWITIMMITATIAVFYWTRPWVTVFADRVHIRVGDLRFSREHFGWLRLGYEIETSGALLKNDFHDLDIGLQGLRLVYGPWGEDLPYLVNKYHANEIVLWINTKIAETAPPQPTPVATSGDRPQSF